ncbi:MAG: hypothetical protein ACTSQZ_05750 [Candidatus Thorarchaeota archaeon]
MQYTMNLEKKVGSHTLILKAETIGCDYLVTIYGGDEHHIGGIALAYPTKSHYRDATTVSVNTITAPGHKDYLVANTAAEKICKALNTLVVVSVGIHINEATKDEITEIIKVVDSLVEDLIVQYQKPE